MAQLAEVAGSLTGYQTNLQQKIQDIRGLSEGGGALSRFMAMVASLGHDLALTTGPRRRRRCACRAAVPISRASRPSWRPCCIRC